VIFLLFCPKEIGSYETSDITKYLLSLQDIGLLNSSIARKRVALGQFFGFLKDNDIATKVIWIWFQESSWECIYQMF
jgi:site-specific recombinase XerD